jgi:hypothetical protein
LIEQQVLQELQNPLAKIAISLTPPQLFRSFWMGGYECATQINAFGERLDMIASVQHDVQAEQDYALLKTVGIESARDGARWHLIDNAGNGNYDWSSFEPMFEAAQRQGIQVIWDICHYGWPDGLDLFSSAFVDRFAKFCRALAQFIQDRSDDVPFYAPMNEISFLSWGASRDFMFPFAHGKDNEIKRQITRAAIAGSDAILSVDPRARLVFPEPLINVMAPRDRPDLADAARLHHESQFEAWDMIAGFQQPDLGGDPRYLDILGANFYCDNQWEVDCGRKLLWHVEPRDDRWEPVHRLLGRVYERYRRPLFLAETSHVGIGRARWILEIGEEVRLAREQGTPVEGVCLYPILDRFDWQDASHWHNSGLWDFHHEPDGKFVRVLNLPYATALKQVQNSLASVGCW